ncbi:MAG TPA: class I SAM-dependent methyltransferase [Isosphaeraceae bacterium]|nr:class I SAM-dependent methyltransferase [Isosphaeraceae bacterium]
MSDSRGSSPPGWRLPRGVNGSLWEYAHTPRLAEDEDDYFAGHPLFVADAHALDERFREPAPLIDLGCGAGRLSLRFARAGFPVTSVDLSRPMLKHLGSRLASENLRANLVQANLCRLTCFPDGRFRYALSMFSTLGMIRGSAARREALRETARVLEPGGRLALHAHNLWLNLKDPQGRQWLRRQIWARWRDPDSAGDRRMTYRGIPNMEVHLYRWSELMADLRSAGLQLEESIPIESEHARPISARWLLPGLRAGGWLVFARKRA